MGTWVGGVTRGMGREVMNGMEFAGVELRICFLFFSFYFFLFFMCLLRMFFFLFCFFFFFYVLL
jgi:hypothetical protein